jgi:hypothetical protein
METLERLIESQHGEENTESPHRINADRNQMDDPEQDGEEETPAEDTIESGNTHTEALDALPFRPRFDLGIFIGFYWGLGISAEAHLSRSISLEGLASFWMLGYDFGAHLYYRNTVSLQRRVRSRPDGQKTEKIHQFRMGPGIGFTSITMEFIVVERLVIPEVLLSLERISWYGTQYGFTLQFDFGVGIIPARYETNSTLFPLFRLTLGIAL